MTNRQLEIQNRISAIIWDIVNEPEKNNNQIAEKWGFSRWYIRKIRDQLTIKNRVIYRNGKMIGALDDAGARRAD